MIKKTECFSLRIGLGLQFLIIKKTQPNLCFRLKIKFLYSYEVILLNRFVVVVVVKLLSHLQWSVFNNMYSHKSVVQILPDNDKEPLAT